MLEQAGKTRFKPMDGLRGIAVLLIISFHYINNQYDQTDPASLNRVERLLSKVSYFGWCGVDLFFVLSGFLIGSILMKNRGATNFFKAFYVRRFLRIIPVYYLLLVIFILLRYTAIYQPDAYIFEKQLPVGYYFLFLQNFLMGIHNHFGPEALTPTWSLCIEEQFYIIIPMVVYFVKPKYLVYVIISFLLIAPLSRYLSVNWYQTYVLLSSRIDSPGCGFLLAWILQKKHFTAYISRHINSIKWSTALVFLIAAFLYAKVDVGVFNHSLIAVSFTLLLLVVLFTEQTWIGKILSNRLLVKIGGLSYFIYLYHQLVNGLLHLGLLKQKMPILNNGYAVLITVSAFIITCLLAILSFRFIEKPLIQYSHTYKY